MAAFSEAGETTSQMVWSDVWPVIAGIAIILGTIGTLYYKNKAFPSEKSTNQFYLMDVTIGLMPWLITAAGPIVSAITRDGTYSIAAAVGVLGMFFTTIIGSERFTNFSKSIFGLFGEGNLRFIPIVIILGALGLVGGLLYSMNYVTTSVTAVVSMALVLVPMVLAQFDLLRNPDIPAIPVKTLLGKVTAYLSGTPIVAAAATGGGNIEITGEACALPGYDGLGWEVQLAPSNILLPMTILMCHLVEYLDNQNYGGATAVGGLAATIFVLQYASFLSNSCSKYYRWGLAAPLIALLLAWTYAGSAYGVIKYWTGGTENFGTEGIFHPSTAAAPPPTKTAGKSDIKIKTSGTAVTASADLFDQAENEDYEEVVGVLFKDGEPISDVSILKS